MTVRALMTNRRFELSGSSVLGERSGTSARRSRIASRAGRAGRDRRSIRATPLNKDAASQWFSTGGSLCLDIGLDICRIRLGPPRGVLLGVDVPERQRTDLCHARGTVPEVSEQTATLYRTIACHWDDVVGPRRAGK